MTSPSPRISIEKQSSKSKYKILRLIPKAAQASVSFQNPPYNPGREKRADGVSHKLKSRLKKTLSGPLISMIPTEKTKSFETEEPSSPKISCMGQIKHKNKLCKQKQEPKPVLHTRPDKGRSKPTIKRIFSGKRRSDASINQGKPPLPDRAPSISQMRRFASSRDTLADFDWTTGEIDSEGEDDAAIHISAPIRVMEPRKEVNLWRRRTMAQPHPLQLNIVRAR